MRLFAPENARRHLRWIFPVLLAGAASCSDKKPTPRPSGPLVPFAFNLPVHPGWTKNAVIYEVNIRQYTPEGTFTAFVKELPRIKALGVDIIWIMPVQPIGKVNRKGTLGSSYSVANYHEFNPELGSKDDFVALVNAAHQLGLKVILDWVASHTALDHPWTAEHRNYYTIKADGNISRLIDEKQTESDRADFADLNYDGTDLRASMITELKWWLDNTNIDGFRCHQAGLVPEDFWKEVADALRPSYPDLFLLADWESPKLHAWFDATYGSALFQLTNEIAQGKKSTEALTPFFVQQQALYGDSVYLLNAPSNHDENSVIVSEQEALNENDLAAFVLSATVKNSMPLLYAGQEASQKKHLRFFDKDAVNWRGPSLASFYARLFELRHEEAAVWNGEWGGTQTEITTNGGNRVYAFSRVREASTILVFVNFGDAPAVLAYSDFKGTPGPYTDWFSGREFDVKAFGQIAVPAHGFRVLVRNGFRIAPGRTSAD